MGVKTGVCLPSLCTPLPYTCEGRNMLVESQALFDASTKPGAACRLAGCTQAETDIKSRPLQHCTMVCTQTCTQGCPTSFTHSPVAMLTASDQCIPTIFPSSQLQLPPNLPDASACIQLHARTPAWDSLAWPPVHADVRCASCVLECEHGGGVFSCAAPSRGVSRLTYSATHETHLPHSAHRHS